MGRTKTVIKYEITDEIRELQNLAQAASVSGASVDVSISEDLVTINGFKKYNRVEGKEAILALIERAKNSKGSLEFPDHEEEEREAKRLAKEQKKHREPGAPPELKTLIRRAKRIWKKAMNKGIVEPEANTKARLYIERKCANTDDMQTVGVALTKYIEKETK